VRGEEAPEGRDWSADLSMPYTLSTLLAPAVGSFGRYSSPADAANADEASASDAISATATIEAVQ
jgi:hypothetical protein